MRSYGLKMYVTFMDNCDDDTVILNALLLSDPTSISSKSYTEKPSLCSVG